MPIVQLRDFLGHKDLKETQKYLHPTANDIARSLASVDNSRLTPAPGPAQGSAAPGNPGPVPGSEATACVIPNIACDVVVDAIPNPQGVPAAASAAETSQNPVNPEREGDLG